jgi:hypothetical protein
MSSRIDMIQSVTVVLFVGSWPRNSGYQGAGHQRVEGQRPERVLVKSGEVAMGQLGLQDPAHTLAGSSKHERMRHFHRLLSYPAQCYGPLSHAAL